MDRFVEIQLWDFVPQTEHMFLGETNVDIQQAFINDNASWYRLEDPKGLRGACLGKSFSVSPRGSIAGPDVGRLIRRSDFGIQRSISDDVDSLGEPSSLLHPDHAWFAGSRRGSSQSEQLEVEVYQLNKDFSRSLPGSRRSSFQNPEDQRSGEATPPHTYVPSRRRSSIAVRKDPDEILKSLRKELGRTMSLEKPKSKPSSRSKSTDFFLDALSFMANTTLPFSLAPPHTNSPNYLLNIFYCYILHSVGVKFQTKNIKQLHLFTFSSIHKKKILLQYQTKN